MARGVKSVPNGFFPVTVGLGEEQKRFVIPVKYLHHPLFTRLLKEAGEEYGFPNKGLIHIPCYVDEFRHLTALMNQENLERTTTTTQNHLLVPKGFLAVTVGQEERHRRFVIPVKYVNHPLFMQLLEEAEQEYEFDQESTGPIKIPCKVEEFSHVRALIDMEETTAKHNRRHHHRSCFKAC